MSALWQKKMQLWLLMNECKNTISCMTEADRVWKKIYDKKDHKIDGRTYRTKSWSTRRYSLGANPDITKLL